VSVRSLAAVSWQRRALAGIAVLVVLAPAFAWAAARTGYAEPMDNAAALAGAAGQAVPNGLSLLSGYTVPGLGPHLGTLGAGALGVALTLGLALGVGRLLAAGNAHAAERR
jgi:cobalt/nickel transport protein